jgi:hypothetical protein
MTLFRAVLISGSSALLVLFTIHVAATADIVNNASDTQVLERCIEYTRIKVGQEKLEMAALNDLSAFCSKQIYWQFLISDFGYRRAKFDQQNYDDRVLLWMVVCITVAGVALSGIQLLTSYKLAASGKEISSADSTFTLEKNKISVRSSITGLLILTVSFCFFLVFVIWVFQFKEDKVSYPEYPRTSFPTSERGGLGPAPAIRTDSESNNKGPNQATAKGRR